MLAVYEENGAEAVLRRIEFYINTNAVNKFHQG